MRRKEMKLKKTLNDTKILDKVYEHCLKNTDTNFELGVHANIQFAMMAKYIEKERKKAEKNNE